MNATEQKLLNDLEKLITLGKTVIATGGPNNFGYSYRNDSLAFRWKASCLSFFSRAFGNPNHYSRMFTEVFAGYNTTLGKNLERAQGILLGAKDDIESGALRSLQTLVQAEIFF